MKSYYIIALCILFFSLPVFANGMSYVQIEGNTTGVFIPVKEERVEIIQEDLIINISPKESKWMVFNPQMDAEVDVVYNLYNRVDENIKVPIAFIQPGQSTKWQVLLNGKEVNVGSLEIGKNILNIDHSKEWVDPFNGKKYIPSRINKYKQNSYLSAKTFKLVLYPGNHQLLIKYKTGTGMDEIQRFTPVYRFHYYLHPAFYWGDFKKLKINLNIPFAHRLHSSLPLKRINRHSWIGEYEGLPGKEFIIYFSPTAGTLGGRINSRKGACVFLCIFILFLWLVRKFILGRIVYARSLLINLILSLIVGWVGYNTFSKKIFPYPLTVFQYLILWTIILWLSYPFIPVIYKTLKKSDKM